MERPGSRISLIVPVFRDADVVLECLRSILADPDAKGLDLIVVDDASGDDTPDRISEAHLAGVRVIRRDHNGGFARACAEGWRNRDASREVIGVLNADTVVEPGWLSACLEQLLGDLQCGCVVPSVVRHDDPERLDSAGQLYTVPGWAGRRGHGRLAADYASTESVFGPTGCAMLARADVIENCGGLFREDFECYYEDTELGFRLQQSGFKCLHVPGARVQHRISQAYDRIPRRRAYFVSRNSTVLFWTAVPVRRWWSAIPQRCLLTTLLAARALRMRCLIPFIRGRLEAWPLIFKGPSLRRSGATLSKGWLSEARQARR